MAHRSGAYTRVTVPEPFSLVNGSLSRDRPDHWACPRSAGGIGPRCPDCSRVCKNGRMELVSASLGTGKVWMGVAGAALILFGAALLALVDAPRRALHWLDPRRLRRRGAEARTTAPAAPDPPAGQGVMGGGPLGWLNGTVPAPRVTQPAAIATALAIPPAPQPASPV